MGEERFSPTRRWWVKWVALTARAGACLQKRRHGGPTRYENQTCGQHSAFELQAHGLGSWRRQGTYAAVGPTRASQQVCAA